MEFNSGLRRRSLEGTACTPGTTGACLGDETCTYVPNKKAYLCARDIRGSVCAYGGESYKCSDYTFSCDGANMVNDGVCRAYCLEPSDCATSETCQIYKELGYKVCR